MSTDRRTFLNIAAASAVGVTFSSAQAAASQAANDGKRPLAAPEPVVSPVLPYPADALAPHISAETINYHHGKHHIGYYTRLVDLLGGQHTQYDLPTLVQMAAKGDGKLNRDVYNSAAQLWNHNFYWRGLRPVNTRASAAEPQGALRAAIEKQLGGTTKLLDILQKDAASLFGSGWVWLVADSQGKLSVRSTTNADTPLTDGFRPLWVLDVWEHAYYIDQRNKRAAHVAAILQHLINWDFVAQNYSRV